MKRGAALPVVLFALAICTGLAVGGLYVTRQLARATSATQRGRDLEHVAEGALANALVGWDSSAHAAQAVGLAVERPSTLSTSAVRATVWTTRISEREYWLVAEAETVDKPLLHRRLGLLVSVNEERASPLHARAWSELPQ
jgi:uncharacterized protein HemX